MITNNLNFKINKLKEKVQKLINLQESLFQENIKIKEINITLMSQMEKQKETIESLESIMNKENIILRNQALATKPMPGGTAYKIIGELIGEINKFITIYKTNN